MKILVQVESCCHSASPRLWNTGGTGARRHSAEAAVACGGEVKVGLLLQHRCATLHSGATGHLKQDIKVHSYTHAYTANVYTQTTDLLLLSDVVITRENV